jgi:hypothetical protein
MPLFDFEASGPSAFTFGNSTNPSAATAIVDFTNSTGGNVTFSVSFNAQLSQMTTSISAATVGVVDVPGAGFSVFFNGQTTGSSSITPTNVSLSFQLPSATTGGATAFTGIATLSTTGGSTYTAPVFGNSVVFSTGLPLNGFGVTSLNVNFTCFCAGTRIATPSGTCLVEDIQPGDIVRLADGRDATVRWLARQPVDTKRANPKEANPIRITKDALGDNLPERDLRVSPDHAIAIDGYLINAGALVNGTTIYQEQNLRENFTYYHIETDAHDLILAEGVVAETFADFSTRDEFENAAEASDRKVDEMALPRITASRLVPEHIQRRLAPAIAAE